MGSSPQCDHRRPRRDNRRAQQSLREDEVPQIGSIFTKSETPRNNTLRSQHDGASEDGVYRRGISVPTQQLLWRGISSANHQKAEDTTTVQSSTVQCSAVQYSAVQYSTLHGIALRALYVTCGVARAARATTDVTLCCVCTVCVASFCGSKDWVFEQSRGRCADRRLCFFVLPSSSTRCREV